jgi:phenylacetate-CoA ligase
MHLVSEDHLDQCAPFGLSTTDERQARFSTPRCTGRECYIERQSQAQRCYGNNLILNSSSDPMYMSEAALRSVAEELEEWSPQVLSGNPWYLTALLRAFEKWDRTPPESVLVVLLGTEFVQRPIERYITNRCGLVPFDNYSTTEIGNIACRCPLGAYHVFDSVLVEVVRGGRPARVGEEGEVIVSHLERRAMPLIRYRVGDLAIPMESCPCGLPQQAISLAGRTADCLLLDDERFVSAANVDKTIGELSDVLFYRATQRSDGRIEFEFSPLPSAENRARDLATTIADTARKSLGIASCDVRAVERLHARESMKFSTIVSKLPRQSTRMTRLLGNDAVADLRE